MSTYTYRRDLKRADWMKAVGIGAGAGLGAALATTYLAQLFLRRTPLSGPTPGPPAVLPPRRR